MEVSIQFLGTGGAFTRSRENFHNNALLKIGNYRLLIDCGGNGIRSLVSLEGF